MRFQSAATVMAAVLALSSTGGCAAIARSSQTRAGVEQNLGDDDPETNIPDISGDGRFVTFVSPATNLVPSDTNGHDDVFVRDREAGITERINLSTGGAQANGASFAPSISDDGRYVAYFSDATNLVLDNNAVPDVFVRDRQTNTTTRVSVNGLGNQANGPSDYPEISGDGRFVVFQSNATNLVPADTNGEQDVFVRDLLTGTTDRVNLTENDLESTGWGAYPSISFDGGRVAFVSSAADLIVPLHDTNAVPDVFVRDRIARTTTRVSVASNGSEATLPSHEASISGDGSVVAFSSEADDLVSNDNNGIDDVFAHELATGVTARMSVTSSGAEGPGQSYTPAINGNGRYVAYYSLSPLVPDDTGEFDVYLRDRDTDTTTRASVRTGGGQVNGSSLGPAVSANGGVVAFVSEATNLVTDDTNTALDTFVHEPAALTTARVSVSQSQANASSEDPSASDDGRYVAFSSEATNLVPGDTNSAHDIFVRDHATGAVERVSVASQGQQANDSSHEPAISGNGRWVAFLSFATNLAQPDSNGSADVFVHDRVTGATAQMSVATGGGPGNLDSLSPAISDDGRYVAFVSFATNFVVPDTNGPERDVFVRDRATGITSLVSRSTAGVQANAESLDLDLSGDGRYVAFSSIAWNLVQSDGNSDVDVFRHDRSTGATVRVSVSTFLAEANDNSTAASISDDGDVVAFESDATNLVTDTNGVRDVFVRKLSCSGQFCLAPTTRASVATGGSEAHGASESPDVSDDGRWVTFGSSADDLVPLDSNSFDDIFVRDRATARTARANTAQLLGQAVGGDSQRPSISGDGRAVAFSSAATNLVDGDTDGVADVFLRAQPVPTVTGVTPNSHGSGGASFGATISGTNFLSGAQIRFSKAGITAVVNTVNDTTIVATFTIAPSVPSGPVDVYVANPGTGPGFAFGALGRCTGCFTVT